MKLKIFQVDAFTDTLFKGNPAAVCPLESWLSDEILQSIAMENNLAETAFYVRKGRDYEIRWFTPTIEVDLCGHATLAAGFVIFEIEGFGGTEVIFHSQKSGKLSVRKIGAMFALNFPADEYRPVVLTETLASTTDTMPVEAYKGNTDYMLVFKDENQIKDLIPNFARIATLDARGLIVTARGLKSDFVSRFFAPQSGIYEDPVTGSAHTTMTPYWFDKLEKETLSARQLSRRGGTLTCRMKDDRVEISGGAKLYLSGEIQVE